MFYRPLASVLGGKPTIETLRRQAVLGELVGARQVTLEAVGAEVAVDGDQGAGDDAAPMADFDTTNYAASWL